MSDTVIRVENLGKKYVIGHQQEGERYTALRDVVANGGKGLAKRFNPLKPRSPLPTSHSEEDFWALKDVSFEIKQGDRVGIIGRNGAGKSTLLKILSRITEPTEGRIKIRGRMASLLEVGTGFHPELTGRENIYLNGAILGMEKAEIRRKFDEIVAFAEVERFLDTPVKRYSSGMYVRLAFAVAAHLEPEILVVDEVLAVGDAQFQEKCLGKMEDVAKEGRSVIFVSHNMGSIKALCDRGILLNKGSVIANGRIQDTIEKYFSRRGSSLSSHYSSPKDKQKPYFKRIKICQEGASDNLFNIDKSIDIFFEIETFLKKKLVVSVMIKNSQGLCICHSSDEFGHELVDRCSSKRICSIPAYALASGKYYIDVSLGQRNIELFESITDVLGFEVDFVGQMSNWTKSSDWKGVCGAGLLSWVS